VNLSDVVTGDAYQSARRTFTPPPGLDRWPPVQLWTDAYWHHWLKQHDWSVARIQQYLDRDRYDYGFGLLKNGTLADHTNHDQATWLYHPIPLGVSLHASLVANLLFGGSAGSTKSTSARWQLWRRAFDEIFASRVDQPYRALIARRELEQLRRQHLDKFEHEAKRICLVLGDEKAIKVTQQPALVTVQRTGAKIVGAHAHAPGDEEKYLSEDYDDIVIDEATRLLPDQLIGIQSRVRSDPKLGIIGHSYWNTNPGGPSHDLCVRYFLTKNVTPEENDGYDPNDFAFIRARLYDNPYYMDADGSYTTYEKRLKMYRKARRRQMLDGDWNAVVGQFFESFSDRNLRAERIPDGCKIECWFRSGEGGKQPYACWLALLPSGRLHVFAELLMPKEWAIGRCAKTVADLQRDRIRRPLSKAIGSADLFPSGDDTGESPSETCRRNGLALHEGDKNDLFGWIRLKHWFEEHPLDDAPWLTIDPQDCPFMARTVPTLVQDPEAPDLIDPSGETQAAHALRIGVMARPSPSILDKPKPKAHPDAIKHLIDAERRPRGFRSGMIR